MNVNSFKKGILLGLIGCTFMLSGCDRYVAKTNEKIETALERIEEYQLQATIPDMPAPVDTVRMQNDIWLGNSSVKIMEGDPLPLKLEQDDSITLMISESATLQALAQEITDMTGITVRLDDLKSESAIPTEAVPVNYAGKLSGLLNYMSNRYGVWWRYKNGSINFFTKETRVFTIYALPTETKMSADLKGTTMGSGTSNGAGGNTSSSLSTSADLALWDSIEEGIKQVVGENGTLSFSRVTGTVTVTASPYMMQKVASYIANWNEKLSRQVAISVKVLQVQLNNEDKYGLNLKAIFDSKNIKAELFAPVVSNTIGSAGSLAMTLVRPSSDFGGSNAIIEAFSTQGKTSLLTSASVTTLNNKVAPVQITTSQNYVKEVNVTNYGGSDDSDSEIDMETDTLNYGFTMEILPRILDHGRLIVLFSMTISDLLDLDKFSSSTNDTNNNNSSSSDNNSNGDNNEDETDTEQESTTVQLPKMQMRGFMQEIAMRSGSTLVLTGFEQVNDSMDTSGIGQAKMTLLGGQAYNTNRRDVIVILMTPEVLESPMSPEARMREF